MIVTRRNGKVEKAPEAYAWMYRVKVKHHHAENGRFADNTFQQTVTQEGQTIAYCGGNAHFQNGKEEKLIRDIQEQTRNQVQHAKSRYPRAVELALWPYTLRQENHLSNT